MEYYFDNWSVYRDNRREFIRRTEEFIDELNFREGQRGEVDPYEDVFRAFLKETIAYIDETHETIDEAMYEYNGIISDREHTIQRREEQLEEVSSTAKQMISLQKILTIADLDRFD